MSSQNRHRWADLEFPDVFGRKRTREERFIEELDEKTGASLKLTLLNPKGRIWNLVAGGGASVIFADTVADLGYGELLVRRVSPVSAPMMTGSLWLTNELALGLKGNYGEYSGAPNEEETYHYARTVLDLATRNAVNEPSQPRTALLIGGGIANFTDVAQTFKVCVCVRACACGSRRSPSSKLTHGGRCSAGHRSCSQRVQGPHPTRQDADLCAPCGTQLPERPAIDPERMQRPRDSGAGLWTREEHDRDHPVGDCVH